jgi:hypothetical protein
MNAALMPRLPLVITYTNNLLIWGGMGDLPEPSIISVIDRSATPCQSRHSRLGPSPAWPKLWLLAHILVKFLYQVVGAAEDMMGGEGGVA